MLMHARTALLRAKRTAAAASTWNPADKSSFVTLSAANTVLNSDGTNVAGARGTTSWATGKHYVEMKATAIHTSDSYFLVTGTMSMDLIAAGSFGLFMSGSAYVIVKDGNTVGGLAPTPANNDVIGFAYDAASGINISVNGSFYDTSGTAVGSTPPGTPLLAVTGQTLFPSGFCSATNSNVTIISTGTPPSGYTAWG